MTNVLTLPLSEHQAKDILSETAKDSARLIFTNHAIERMEQRNITRTDVTRVLCNGRIKEGPAMEPSGSWKVTVEGISAGDLISVVAAIDYKVQTKESCYTVVITAYS